MGYTTISDQFYKHVGPQQLLDGARIGIAAYIVSRGIADPRFPVLRARADGRGVEPAIERQLGLLIKRYGARIEVRDLVYGAIRGELGALHDPYSVFFTKAELARFTTALDGTAFGGIGIVLAGDSLQHYRADQVFAGAPAAAAGVLAGDRIIAVNGTAVDGLASAAISRLLRGRIGTTVRLDVRRTGEAESRRFTIVRAAITPPDVSARLLPTGIAYIGLRTFGPTAGQQVHAALIRLRAQGAIATIFDLRGNGGGYESSAISVASAFIPHGSIVMTQTNHGQRRTTVADGSALAPEPLAVLVDHDSASGSELVTGAIQDHALGRIIGTRTFGKGLVQTLFPLPDGSAMKVTTARYFTPHGRDIDRIGIVPDVVIAQPAAAVTGEVGRDPQLDAALAAVTSPVTPALASPSTYR